MKTSQEWLDTTPGYQDMGPAEQAVARRFVESIQNDALASSPTLTDPVLQMRAQHAEAKVRILIEGLTGLREAMLRLGWTDVVAAIDKVIVRMG